MRTVESVGATLDTCDSTDRSGAETPTICSNIDVFSTSSRSAMFSWWSRSFSAWISAKAIKDGFDGGEKAVHIVVVAVEESADATLRAQDWCAARAEAPIGTIWSSSPCTINVGMSKALRSSVWSVSEKTLMQSYAFFQPEPRPSAKGRPV